MNMSIDEEDIPVSSTDELSSDGGEQADRVRKFGEYKPTNTPLPAVEVEDRAKHGWPPHTPDAVHEIVPLEEHEVLTEPSESEL